MKAGTLVALLLGATLSLAACDRSPADEGPGVTFVVRVADRENYRIRLQDDARIAEARALLASATPKIVMGTLARGDGGFNTGYSWHLVPATVTFPDMSIELCDGLPSFVEEERDYWVDTVKSYCPWQARIIQEVR